MGIASVGEDTNITMSTGESNIIASVGDDVMWPSKRQVKKTATIDFKRLYNQPGRAADSRYYFTVNEGSNFTLRGDMSCISIDEGDDTFTAAFIISIGGTEVYRKRYSSHANTVKMPLSGVNPNTLKGSVEVHFRIDPDSNDQMSWNAATVYIDYDDFE